MTEPQTIRADVVRVLVALMRGAPWCEEGLAELEAVYPELGRAVRTALAAA